MGIPYLSFVLSPYTTDCFLQSHNNIVLDGPAFAWHVLHICFGHEIFHPSYELLGQIAIAWLNEVTNYGCHVAAIYFDGHLPLAKKRTRMNRLMKYLYLVRTLNASAKHDQLTFACLSERREMVDDVFTTGHLKGRRILPPPFHVPAVLEALRASQYASIVQLVPAEADGYCAQYVQQHGGAVITSDSDLILHNLGNGKMVLFGTISNHDDNPIGRTFCPEDLSFRLGLDRELGLCRFAYELKQDPHVSMNALQFKCIDKIKDEAAFKEFCKEYLEEQETSPLPISATGQTIPIGSLDPRISELVLQLGDPNVDPEDPYVNQMFLPVVIDDTNRSSAWEQSTPVRQLAYTIARWFIPGTVPFVREFRRVNEPSQTGRKVPLLSKPNAESYGQELVALMLQLEEDTDDDPSFRWLVYSLILDIRECYEQDKRSHVLHTIKQASVSSIQPKRGDQKIPWDIIHFVAQASAGYYSLRMLKQILSLAPEARTQDATSDLCKLLDSLPPLAKAPSMQNTIEFLVKAGETGLVSLISKYVVLPEDFFQEPDQTLSDKAKRVKEQPSPANTKNRGNPTSRNRFDVLLQDI